jgi:copper chaperone CopZ
LAILLIAVAALLAAPLFACDGESQGTAAATVEKASASSPAGCSAEVKAGCAATGKVCPGAGKTATTTAAATLPNGHPQVSVAEAQKCTRSTTAFLTVNKMTCNGCVTQVTKTLGAMDGVCAVDVSLANAAATVVYHANEVSPEQMSEAIGKAGYAASLTDLEKVDQEKLKQLCAQLCGGSCRGKCKEHCANACRGASETKPAEASEI